MRREHDLGYPVLSDEGSDWARRMGLVYAVPDDLRAVYESFGIDVAAHNADGSWELPLAARIVVDAKGAIRDLEADPDYTRRPEPEATLAVLRELAG